MRRRRASAASSLSRCGLLYSTPSAPSAAPPTASLPPPPELRRVPATLGAAAGTKEDPAAAAPPPPAAPARGGGSRVSGSPLPEGSARSPPRRRRARARLPRSKTEKWLRRLTRPQGPCCVVQDVAFMGILGQMECVLFATKNIFRGSRIVAE